jgi:hypothetical protein
MLDVVTTRRKAVMKDLVNAIDNFLLVTIIGKFWTYKHPPTNLSLHTYKSHWYIKWP